jgi:anti-sigma B factor antagonist
MIGLSIDIETKNTYSIVHIKGEIDCYSCPILQEKLEEVIANGHLQIILDLTNLYFIDSTGLGTIAYTAQDIKGQNGQLHIICTHPQIKRIFQISGLEKRNITLYTTESAVFEKLAC